MTWAAVFDVALLVAAGLGLLVGSNRPNGSHAQGYAFGFGWGVLAALLLWAFTGLAQEHLMVVLR